MLEFLIQRIAISIATLFVISLIVFTGVRLIPGDPARVMGGTDADPAGLEEIREKYGLKDPIVLQYLRWIGLALRGYAGHRCAHRLRDLDGERADVAGSSVDEHTVAWLRRAAVAPSKRLDGKDRGVGQGRCVLERQAVRDREEGALRRGDVLGEAAGAE